MDRGREPYSSASCLSGTVEPRGGYRVNTKRTRLSKLTKLSSPPTLAGSTGIFVSFESLVRFMLN